MGRTKKSTDDTEKAMKVLKETTAKASKAAEETIATAKKTAKAVKGKAAEVTEDVKEVFSDAVEKAPETAEKLAETAEKVVKKAAPRRTALKETVYLQYMGREIRQGEITDKIKAIWTDTLGRKASEMKSLTLYIKPEENKVYYVINDDVTGSVEL